jgi:hypothetical protein
MHITVLKKPKFKIVIPLNFSRLLLLTNHTILTLTVFEFQMAAKLSEMVGATNAAGGDGFSWSLLKIHRDSTAGSSSDSSADIAALECNAKLAVALGVLDECFNPVKDRRTGIDMLHQAVYSLG